MDSVSGGATDRLLGNKGFPKSTLDFFGVNHYNRIVVSAFLGIKMARYDTHVSDMGWDVVPSSLYHTCKAVHRRYGLPILVTEHGIAEHAINDVHRSNLISAAIVTMMELTKENIPIIGYTHWSLMDNHEWEQGKKMRFGLFYTDYQTMEFKPRQSTAQFIRIASQIEKISDHNNRKNKGKVYQYV